LDGWLAGDRKRDCIQSVQDRHHALNNNRMRENRTAKEWET
jgi:hypothetical protein